jgi:ribosomal protein L23
MARKTKSKVNKSNAIREIKGANPEAGPTEIAAMVKSQFGVDVTPATVSTVLSTDKKRNGKVGRPGRPKGSKNGSTKAPSASKGVALNGNQDAFIQNLLKAKQLVNDMGGISEARSALNALESLMSAV